MLRPLILAVLVALAPGPFAAAEEGAKPKADDVPRVDLAPVGLPVVWDGRLINYVFVSVRLVLSPHANASALRDKEPYFRDALVRAAHRTPFTRQDDFTALDETALRRVMGAEAARIAGPGAIASVQVMSQTPQRQSGLPPPPKAKARTTAAAH